MQYPNVYNYEAGKAQSLVNASAVREICQPLIELLNIAGFTFHRIYKDGGRIYFSSCEKWIEHHYEQNYFLATGYKKFSMMNDIQLWARWPDEDASFIKIVLSARERFGLANGLCVNRIHEEYIDSFSFRGRYGDDEINHKYLMYFSYIDKFLHYFLKKLAKQISEANKLRFIIPEEAVINISSIPNMQAHASSTFVNQFPNVECLLDCNGKFLSKRESECVIQLVLGQTAKGIARALYISPRTAEAYINNIRNKLGCTTKSQIIQKILSQKYNQEIISGFVNYDSYQ